MTEKCCGTCKWWDGHDAPDEYGNCCTWAIHHVPVCMVERHFGDYIVGQFAGSNCPTWEPCNAEKVREECAAMARISVEAPDDTCRGCTFNRYSLPAGCTLCWHIDSPYDEPIEVKSTGPRPAWCPLREGEGNGNRV